MDTRTLTATLAVTRPGGGRAARAALGTALGLLLALLPVAAQSSGGNGGGGGGGGSAVTVVSIGADNSTPPPSSSGTATVLLSADAPSGGALVTLTSSNPAALSVPASVLVAQGAPSGQLAYTTGAVSSATAVTLKATLGSSSVSTTVTVTPVGLLCVLALPSAIQGGGVDTIRSQLTGPAPAGGIVVSLASDSSAAPVPASVTIPPGPTRRR